MSSKVKDLKQLLKTLNIDWNDLFEAKFNSKTYTPPFYFGVLPPFNNSRINIMSTFENSYFYTFFSQLNILKPKK
jgi:hypothetical protein